MVISSRKQQNVDQTVALLKGEGLQIAGCVCHVGNKEHIQRLVQVREPVQAVSSICLVHLLGLYM